MKTVRTATLLEIFGQLVAWASPVVLGLGPSACTGEIATTPGDAALVDAAATPGDAALVDAAATPGDATLVDAAVTPDDASLVDANFYCVVPPYDPTGPAGPPNCPTCYARLAELPDADAFDALPYGEGGIFAQTDGIPCTALCGGDYFSCSIVDASLPASVICQPDCTGRRPEGLRRSVVAAESPIGAYFAAMAQLEAASVPAFRRMARELAGFGAPGSLVRLARRAARDEVRHARATRRLAHRFGAAPASFDVAAHAPRSLESFAVENVIEGCVRETYGALEATWQARTAADPQVRAQMTRIARDETRHATLAFQVDAWVRGRLGVEGSLRVEEARAAARAELHRRLTSRIVGATVARVAGVPTARIAARLALGLEARLSAA